MKTANYKLQVRAEFKLECLTAMLVGLVLVGCGVEIRDKNQQVAPPLAELIVEKEYSIPVPLTQSEKLILRYDRLILKRDARFITNGLNLRIEVGELLSDDGVIATFPQNSVASKPSNGRSGGNLELIIGQASGKLRIEKLGEAGANGIHGGPPDALLKGPKGVSGVDSKLYFVGTGRIPFPASDGAAGGQGKQGYHGANGFQGGNTGQTYVKISFVNGFVMDVINKGGKGGAKGLGGPGGAGGDGGEPGRENPYVNNNDMRTYTKSGPEGPQGPKGNDGLPGADGTEEMFCEEIGNTPLKCTGKPPAPEKSILPKLNLHS